MLNKFSLFDLRFVRDRRPFQHCTVIHSHITGAAAAEGADASVLPTFCPTPNKKYGLQAGNVCTQCLNYTCLKCKNRIIYKPQNISKGLRGTFSITLLELHRENKHFNNASYTALNSVKLLKLCKV